MKNKIIKILIIMFISLLPPLFAQKIDTDSENLINQLTTSTEQAEIAFHKLWDYRYLEVLKNHLFDTQKSKYNPYSQKTVEPQPEKSDPLPIGDACRLIIAGLLDGVEETPRGYRFYEYTSKETIINFLNSHSYDSLLSLQLEAAKYIKEMADKEKYGNQYIEFWEKRIKELELKIKNP